MKRLAVAAGVALVVLLSGCAETGYNNLVQQSQSTAEAAAPTESNEPAQLFGLNEMATFGDYGVIAFKTKLTKGNETNRIQVIVKVKNLGKQPIQIDSSYFNLIDGSDRQFDPSADLTFNDDGTAASFLMETINPGLSLQKSVFFDVPPDVTEAKLSMRDNMFDFGGAKYVFIDLGQIK